MKANELKIGNWVHSDEMDEPIQVNAHQILHQASLKSLLSGFIEPISLSDDWLVNKLGFELIFENDDMSRYRKNTLIVEWIFGGYTARIKIDDEESLFIKEIEYVHSLQNLYQELTPVIK